MGNKRSILLAALLICIGLPCAAQRWSLGTNFMDYANFGTMNLEGSLATGQHWSMTAVAKFNPFHYEKKGEPLSARQQLYGVGVRFWPWHVYSGWWAGSRLQYQQYNNGGLVSPETSEGERYGLTLSGGYTYMLSDRVNVEFGAAFWGGWGWYATYDCPVCGLTVDRGKKFFVLPDEAIISLVYLF